MKNILLIGLGRFGRHMAQKLHDLNHQVLAIDKDERRVLPINSAGMSASSCWAKRRTCRSSCDSDAKGGPIHGRFPVGACSCRDASDWLSDGGTA